MSLEHYIKTGDGGKSDGGILIDSKWVEILQSCDDIDALCDSIINDAMDASNKIKDIANHVNDPNL